MDSVKDNSDVELTPTREDCFNFDNDTRTIIRFKCYYSDDMTDIVIPGTINGIPVEHIGETSFYNGFLTSVEFGLAKDLITIGGYAFYFEQFPLLDLSKLTKLTSIGEFAFLDNHLETIILPKNITNIERAAFSTRPHQEISNNNLSKIVNPTGKAFNWCDILVLFTPSDGNCTFVTGSGTTIGGRTLNIVGR